MGTATKPSVLFVYYAFTHQTLKVVEIRWKYRGHLLSCLFS
jgi:hypothetical protein